MKNPYLFVYGTLMQSSGHPMHQKLIAGSEFVCHGWITAQLYQIRDYPGVIESDASDDKVYGEVYRLTEPGLLALLDDFETCSSAFPEPHEYRRKEIEVFVSAAKMLRAWAYIYNHPVDPAKRIKSGKFRRG